MLHRPCSAIPLLVAAFLLTSGPASAQTPTIAETAWTLTSSFAFTGVRSARLNPRDGALYALRRGSGSDGLYRLGAFGRSSRIAAASNPAGLAIDGDGHAFFSEDFGGVVYRVALGATTRSSWASGFHTGDDDPTGLAIAPPTHDGSLVAPGTAIVADRGVNGPDELWTFTTSVSTTPRVLHTDDGTLVDPVDVAIGVSDVFVVDSGEAQDGRIYRVGAAGALSEVPTLEPLPQPVGLSIDPMTGDLLIAEASTGRVLRLGVSTGTVAAVVTGLPFPTDGWSSVAVSTDGRQMIVTGANAVYVFSRCATGQSEAGDCNGNGSLDACDLAVGRSFDCNQNQRPDECDVAEGGGSSDCDGNLVPDECPQCAPVEAVFVMDTSASMDDEAAAICADIETVAAELRAQRISLLPTILGISANPSGAYSCLSGNVIARYGTSVPGAPPAGLETLGMCPGGNEVASEDWGRAAAVVAGRHAWTPDAARVVVPIADEGPWCGDPVLDPGNDRDSVTHASTVAASLNVFISPITGTGASAAVVRLAQALASGTGGIWHASTDPQTDLAESILATARASCVVLSDCNANGTPDTCDLRGGRSADCDGDGRPDECQPEPVECTDAGLPEDAGEVAVDATADAGTPSEVDAGAPEDAGEAPSPEPREDDEGGGCNCRAQGPTRSGSPWFFALCLTLPFARRRRSLKRSARNSV